MFLTSPFIDQALGLSAALVRRCSIPAIDAVGQTPNPRSTSHTVQQFRFS